MNEQDIRADERAHCLKAVEEWFRIRQDEGFRRGNRLPLMHWPDVSHSALLKRLLAGAPKFPDPPPRSCSYPHYELAAGELCETSEVTLHPQEDGSTVVYADQAAWELVSQDGEVLTVRWAASGELYRIWPAENKRGSWKVWHIQRVPREGEFATAQEYLTAKAGLETLLAYPRDDTPDARAAVLEQFRRIEYWEACHPPRTDQGESDAG